MTTINSPLSKPTKFKISDNGIAIQKKDGNIDVLFTETERIYVQPLIWFPFWHRYALRIVKRNKEEVFLSSYKKIDLNNILQSLKSKNIPVENNPAMLLSLLNGVIPIRDLAFSNKKFYYILCFFIILAVIFYFVIQEIF